MLAARLGPNRLERMVTNAPETERTGPLKFTVVSDFI